MLAQPSLNVNGFLNAVQSAQVIGPTAVRNEKTPLS
jgi:hypothetical protein